VSASQSPSASDRPQGQAVSSAVASANQSPNAQAGRQEQRPRIRQREMEEKEAENSAEEEPCSAGRKNEQLVVCWCNEVREQEPTIECAAGEGCICGGRVHRRCAGRHDFERSREQTSYL